MPARASSWEMSLDSSGPVATRWMMDLMVAWGAWVRVLLMGLSCSAGCGPPVLGVPAAAFNLTTAVEPQMNANRRK